MTGGVVTVPATGAGDEDRSDGREAAAATPPRPARTVRTAHAYEALLEGSSDGVLHTDRAGTVLAANPAACRLLESTVEDGRFVAQLEEVRRLGVAVAIDDFGTGYSSLSRLASAPVDVIKIDRSFVAAAGTPKGRALLAGIVTLAHSIGAYTIAEGIETPEQLDAIVEVGADAAAGFLLAPPQPAGAVSWRSAHPIRGPRPAPRGDRAR